MRKTLHILGIIAVNVILVIASFILKLITDEIINITDSPHSLEFLIFLPFAFTGLILARFNKCFRLFSIGLTAFSLSVFIFLIFFLNNKITMKGEYENFKLIGVSCYGEDFYLNIAYNKKYSSTNVPLDKGLMVDTVQVRVDTGIFGMRTMSNDIRIIEKQTCPDTILNSVSIDDKLKAAELMIKSRCFSSAYNLYLKSIELDPFDSRIYYNRGRLFLENGKYDDALKDILYWAILTTHTYDHNSIGITIHKSQLDDKIQNNDFEDIEKFIRFLGTNKDYRTQEVWLSFCLNKIK